MSKVYLLYTDNEWSDNSDYLLLSEKQILPMVDSWGSACISSFGDFETAAQLFTRQDDDGIHVFAIYDDGDRFDPKTDRKWCRLNNGDWIDAADLESDDDRLYKIFLCDETQRDLKNANLDLSLEFDNYYELCKGCAKHLFSKLSRVLPELSEGVVDESFAPVDENKTSCELCGKQLDPRT